VCALRPHNHRPRRPRISGQHCSHVP
jgi:hypothetical protein